MVNEVNGKLNAALQLVTQLFTNKGTPLDHHHLQPPPQLRASHTSRGCGGQCSRRR
jgi:hypothetical protein